MDDDTFYMELGRRTIGHMGYDPRQQSVAKSLRKIDRSVAALARPYSPLATADADLLRLTLRSIDRPKERGYLPRPWTYTSESERDRQKAKKISRKKRKNAPSPGRP